MKRHKLTRKESQRLSRDQTGLSESIAAPAYGYALTLSETYDAARETGAVIEVKSTVTEYENGRSGRFRLYKPQHDRLRRKDNSGSGKYVFVLFDVSQRPPVATMKKVPPAKIGNIIAGRGGWNASNRSTEKGHQLPYNTIF